MGDVGQVVHRMDGHLRRAPIPGGPHHTHLGISGVEEEASKHLDAAYPKNETGVFGEPGPYNVHVGVG